MEIGDYIYKDELKLSEDRIDNLLKKILKGEGNMAFRLYGDSNLIKKLEEMRDETRTDLDKHEEHNALVDVIDELEHNYDEINGLERLLIEAEGEMVNIDSLLDIVDDYYSWTNEQLKERLRVRDLPVSGTKQELVRRLVEDNRKRGEI